MGSYRQINHMLRPFGDVEGGSIDGVPAPGLGIDLTALASQAYQTNWPGVIGLATGLSPGAGVTAPSAAPALLQAPAEGTPGVATSSGSSPWLLIAGAVALYYFVLRG
jgi:hypothetical protein